MKNYISFIILALVISGCFKAPGYTQISQIDENLLVEVGQALFFDPNLSKNKTQSCSTCHNPNFAFVDDRDNGVKAQVSLGDDGVSLGDRTAPTASYAKFSPIFHFDKEKNQYIGGQFWDARVATLEEQAGGPPLNPIEMGMPSKKAVVERIKENEYYVKSFKKLFGNEVFKDNEFAYEAMTKAIGAFEKTDFFSPFDSKYDRYLREEEELSLEEELGMSLFFSNNNTNCSTCHKLKFEGDLKETFTNYEFHNIGVPINKSLRAKNGVKELDKGLLANPKVKDKAHEGKFKVPTLRNIAITAPYMHNGVFKDLRTVLEFYDKYNNEERAINKETNKPWDEPEVEHSVNLKDLKAKKLTDKKIDAIIAFLKTLTDKRYEHLLEK